ncbi:triacylglycerol lipase OBL1-like [Mercurialis annua]|uniref:triacylglycerol lipase OBL1-like n=1 Tax=Mercurialis annua TaxID=3986 RepID=UPI00215EB148|nr:triacylglycerol lipase OBL1-like [Mercurialis annua]
MDKTRSPSGVTGHMVVHHDGGSFWDLFKFAVFGNMESAMKFINISAEGTTIMATAARESRWYISVAICKILKLFDRPLELFGHALEFCLNFYHQNGGFFGIPLNALLLRLKIPRRGTENFISFIGFTDPRVDLQRSQLVSHQADEMVIKDAAPHLLKEGHNLSVQSLVDLTPLMDLCIMAAKLAYENTAVVHKVVTKSWKESFVADYQGMNYYTCKRDTHAFIFCDKKEDANLIVISFRGTGPFTMRNWCSDFDFSLVQFGDAGSIHVGFLEAMGLGHRHHPPSFGFSLQARPVLIGSDEFDFNRDGVYSRALGRLRDLIKEHTKAKIVVTGHSLGGALAIVFACLLVIQNEIEVLDRLLNVYTYGQPRVGDFDLALYMQSRLNFPSRRYFRVVYCNDIVPRVPFDDVFFTFEHFGICVYYDSFYFGYFTKEERTRNFFGLGNAINMHITAWWELMRSFITGLYLVHGAEYKETWVSIAGRVAGLILPGISAHSPVNYINSVRLGRQLKHPLMSLQQIAAGQYMDDDRSNVKTCH